MSIMNRSNIEYLSLPNKAITLLVTYIPNVGICIQDKDTYKIHKMTMNEDQIKLILEVLMEQNTEINDLFVK